MKKRKNSENTGKIDYQNYRFTGKEILKYFLQTLLLCALGDYLFYQNVWVLILVVPASVWMLKIRRKQRIRERKRKLNYEFRDALTAMSVAVQAGYSVENAISICTKDLEQLCGRDSDIWKEFRYIETQQKVSVPVEDLFLDLADRSGIEDIENFASVFQAAKRTGGDMNRIIQKVARMLSDKIEVKKEIEATLAAKKGEQMVMSLMPVGIIVYLKLTSPGFLDIMYGNILGICAMTFCLAVYLIAFWLGRKIVEIEV